MIHFVVQQKLTQHCKAIILQKKKKRKEMSYKATKIHKENLNAYCLGKENCMKKVQTIRFQIYDILVKTKL